MKLQWMKHSWSSSGLKIKSGAPGGSVLSTYIIQGYPLILTHCQLFLLFVWVFTGHSGAPARPRNRNAIPSRQILGGKRPLITPREAPPLQVRQRLPQNDPGQSANSQRLRSIWSDPVLSARSTGSGDPRDPSGSRLIRLAPGGADSAPTSSDP